MTSPATPVKPAKPVSGANLTNLPIDKVVLKKGFNPRTDMGDLGELKSSIRKQGLISPLTVVPTKAGADTYFVIAGHRRLLALKELGKKTVPVVIRDDLTIDSTEAFAFSVSENSAESRYNLSDLDQAAAFKRILDASGGDGNEGKVASLTGYSAVHVKRTLRLLNVSSGIKKRMENNDISKRAAEATTKLPDEIRSQVEKALPPEATEGDVLRLANDAKRRLSGKADDVAVSTTTAAGNRNTPAGRKPGQIVVARGKREVRKKILSLAAEALNAKEDNDDEKYSTAAIACAALLWSQGDLGEIDINTKVFAAALKEIQARLDEINKAGPETADDGEEAPKAKAKPVAAAKPVKAKAKAAAAEEDEDAPTPASDAGDDDVAPTPTAESGDDE
jgi:ParB/RepB/Spo0J family partition protein